MLVARSLPRAIERVLEEYDDVMLEQLPKGLPPRREVDHEIELVPGTKPPIKCPFRMSPSVELRKQLDGLLEAGFIRPSKAPFRAPVLFQKKHDGSLRVVEGDEPKNDYITQYGAFEFLVMMFGLTNAPATFCPLMNKEGVLLQNGHPVAFESRKLNGTKSRYTTQEKELLALIHCLRAWRHYLLGMRFVVRIDNIVASHILTQPKLSARQARWQEFLAEFDFEFEHKAGKKNQVADALTRRVDLAALRKLAPNSVSRVTNNIRELIAENIGKDP
ncbi:hypothetical protein V6N12_069527 [Hibiscus sabdariffa]|uniref:Reverse transcriptase RNase H-like domain-containing protein n=1 Tax=Hibiscus sabdariffa TaxID=183260 RepID=A0ABR2FE42_9ROSI